ncbi:tankyrase-like protein isoform X2 [Limulus polyphemus]|uniref:Poly [ADP-ribose] polymerase n=1 Tax=Limulus polyphemus TaxID=6850 RepID=A0ABM1S679_LIMPO|nr:tankyrase-like protein isoform X2 [Limulus polyphemus]
MLFSSGERELKQRDRQKQLGKQTTRRSTRIMDQHLESNGCEDGPIPLNVTNHSDTTQEKTKKSDRQPSKHSSSGRHGPARPRRQAPAISASILLPPPGSPPAERRPTRHSPSSPGQTHSVTSSVEKKPQKVATSSPPLSLPSQPSPNKHISQCSPTASNVILTQIMSLNKPEVTTSPSKYARQSQPSSSKLSLSTPERKKRKRHPQTVMDPIPSHSNKRIRLQYQPFQSPAPISPIPSIFRQHPAKSPDDKIVLFNKGEFLAVRNENGGFFVCRASQNVYKSSKRFKIQWLSNDNNTSVYTPDFFDFTDFECVLTNLRMNEWQKKELILPSDERKRTLNILQRALNVESGMDIPDPRQLTMDGVDVSIVGKEDLGSPKSGLTQKTNKSSVQKGRGRPKKSKTEEEALKQKNLRSADSGKKPKTITAIKTKVREPAKMRFKAARVKKEENKDPRTLPLLRPMTKIQRERLQPNPKIKVQEKSPMFESGEPLPYVSPITYSKLIIRAVRLKDHHLLQSLLSDKEHVCSYTLKQSKDVLNDALTYAIVQEDHQAIRMILSAEHKNLVTCPEHLLSRGKIGSCNRSLFDRSIYSVSIIGGSREGNAALLKDSAYELPPQADDIKVIDALSAGVSLGTLNVLCSGKNSLHSDMEHFKAEKVYPNIVVALRHGHCKMAGQLIQECIEQAGHGFSSLHRDVLLNESKPLNDFEASSVLKNTHENSKVTPIHCAAINPNSKYLSSLLSVVPQCSVVDSDGWQPIHYAATCQSTGPLELLLSRNVSIYETEAEGNTPLHLACQTGRHHNVELLLKYTFSTAQSGIEDEDSSVDKFGVCGCERLNKKSYSPLHLAVLHGHLNVVKVLLKYSSVNKPTSAAADKLTPLMLAAQQGYLPIVKFLVEKGRCLVEVRDKKYRTALTHAVINGHAHVASYLLRIGADPNTKDSSGNTLVHYAAAYGWYYCLKLLVVEAEADPNVANDLKVSPLAVAFLKGHMGLVDFLLEIPSVDVNVYVGESDMSLVMHTVRSRINVTQLQRLKFLLVKCKSDCRKKDLLFGNNAIHHLVLQEADEMSAARSFQHDKENKGEEDNCLVSEEHQKSFPEDELDEMLQEENQRKHDQLVENIAKLLIFHGCDPKEKNKAGESAFSLAVKKGCLVLAKVFLEHGCELTSCVGAVGGTLLHSFIQQALDKDISPLLKAFLSAESKSPDSSPRELLRHMATRYNSNGRTPLLEALWSLKTTKRTESVKRLLHFIKFLLEDLCSDVSALVKDKKTGADVCSALHLAAKCKGGRATEVLLAHRPPIDNRDSEGRTPLVTAIVAGNYEAAEALIRAGADVNIFSDKGEQNLPPLLLAARKVEFAKLVPLLVQQKADVNAINPKNGNTALHYIVDMPVSDIDLVKVLVDAGANINAPNSLLQTPLHLAVNSHAGGTDVSLDVQDYLLQKGAKADVTDSFRRIPLHYAFFKLTRENNSFHKDPVELVDLLTRAMGACPVDIADNNGQTPLHLAATCGATISCMLLAQKMKILDVKDKMGNTPLGLSVLNKHEGCAMMLLQKGASCVLDLVQTRPEREEKRTWKWNHVKKAPQSPIRHSILQEAVSIEWQGVLHLMLDQLEAVGKGLTLAVEAAVATRHYQLALKLISQVKLGWTLYSEKQTMLHLLAREAEAGSQGELQVKVAKALIEKGVPVMARDEHGCSVVTYAALNWNDTLCQYFTDKMGMVAVIRADPDKSQRTPFSALFWRLGSEPFPEGIRNWCLNLIRSGASLNTLAHYPVWETPYPGVTCNTKDVTHLEADACSKLSPLMVAIFKQNYEVVKMLISNGADLNFPDEQLRTPLMLAVRLNDVKMVKLLLNSSYNPDNDYKPLSGQSIEFEKTSGVDLTKQDKNGWTVMHHLICPHANFTYSDTTLLYLLAKVGAPINTPDNTGLTPLQLAVSRQAESLLIALQELLKVPFNEQVNSLYMKPPIKVDDGMHIEKPAYSYKTDFAAMVEKLRKEIDVKEQKPEVDVLSGLSDIGELVMDPDQNVPFDALLTLVDLSYGLFDFYKMQIIKHHSRETYVLFTRWGRMGDDGQTQKILFPSLKEAAQEFQKIFHNKSDNIWENLKSFNPQRNKYCLVEMEKRCQNHKHSIKPNLKTDTPSKLPEPLSRLMERLMDASLVEQFSMKLGTSIACFGQLPEAFQKAESLLQEIRKLIEERKESQDINNAQKNSEEILQKIVKLTEEYYFTIPIHGFEYERLCPLYDTTLLRDQIEIVYNLRHTELTAELMLAAQMRKEEINPKDYIYQCLNSQLQLMEEECVEAQLILQYIHNTGNIDKRKRVDVQAIYRVQQKVSSEFLKKSSKKHVLLWHGTSKENILSILTQGLMIPPLGMRLTKHAFGKGILFADMFQEGQEHCSAGDDKESTKFMFLCEVALGKICQLDMSSNPHPDQSYNTHLALGTWHPNPAQSISWQGREIPLGPSQADVDLHHQIVYRSLNFNEYLVCEPSQVCIRYLVQFQEKLVGTLKTA